MKRKKRIRQGWISLCCLVLVSLPSVFPAGAAACTADSRIPVTVKETQGSSGSDLPDSGTESLQEPETLETAAKEDDAAELSESEISQTEETTKPTEQAENAATASGMKEESETAQVSSERETQPEKETSGETEPEEKETPGETEKITEFTPPETEKAVDLSSLPEIADGTYYLESFDEGETHYYELTRTDTPVGGPLLILLHGTNSRKEGMYSFAKSFADAGYVVVVPDLAGHGESASESAMDIVDIIQKTTEYIQQILASYAEVEYVNSEDFAVAGNSLGGVTALYYAANCEPKPKCVISFYGTPVWSGISEYSSHSVRKNGVSVPISSEEVQKQVRERIEKNSPDAHMEKLLSVPILLVNGDKDDLMDLDSILAFEKKAQEVPNSLEVVVKEGHIHGLQMEDQDMPEAKDFLQRYLPAPAME